jgi:hypothetical protein
MAGDIQALAMSLQKILEISSREVDVIGSIEFYLSNGEVVHRSQMDKPSLAGILLGFSHPQFEVNANHMLLNLTGDGVVIAAPSTSFAS